MEARFWILRKLTFTQLCDYKLKDKELFSL